MGVMVMTEKKLLKSEKIRLKNDQLRKKGKNPTKGWGQMINTGLGGINQASGFLNKFDNVGFISSQQKTIGKDNNEKNKSE